jgi:hypothetical protein
LLRSAYCATASVAACAGAGAVFFAAAFLIGVPFFAAFVGAFTAVFLWAAFFRAGASFFPAADFALAAAFCKRHRFFVAAMIAFLPAALSFRLGFEGSRLAFDVGSDAPLKDSSQYRRMLANSQPPSPE